jgi:hypothetical protein
MRETRALSHGKIAVSAALRNTKAGEKCTRRALKITANPNTGQFLPAPGKMLLGGGVFKSQELLRTKARESFGNSFIPDQCSRRSTTWRFQPSVYHGSLAETHQDWFRRIA